MKRYRHIWKILGFDMFVIEFGPVLVFFIAYYLSDFPTAALVLALATFVALFLSRAVNKRVPWFAIFSGTITMITSFLTYVYTSPTILIVKDSVYYVLFASILGVSMWKHRYVFQAFFGHIFAIREEGWRILEHRWMVWFICAAISNEAVRMTLTVEDWVVYKQLMLVAFIIFGLYQFKISAQYRLSEADALGLRRMPPCSVQTRR